MTAAAPHRIAYVIGELGKGGAEYQLHELVRHLDREQFLPYVIVLSGGGWWTQPVRALDVTVTELPRRVPADVARVSGLRAALRRFAPAVLHTVLLVGQLLWAGCCARAAIRVRIAAERNVIRRSWWQRLVERALDRVTEVYQVKYQAVADELVMHGRLPATKTRVIANGIDLGRSPPLPLRAGPLRLLCVVRFFEKKRLDTLIDACGLLRDQGVAFELQMYGDEPLREVLVAQVARLDLGGQVRLGEAIP